MYNFDPYNVLLAIATNIAVTYDCFCAPGTHMYSYGTIMHSLGAEKVKVSLLGLCPSDKLL